MTLMPIQLKKNLISEILVRLFLWVMFIWFDHSTPFIREILPEEMYRYKYPVTPSYVTTSHLWLLVFGIPLAVFFADFCQTKNKSELSKSLLCMTLCYGINGFLTCFFKVMVGRPRPDFFYRCFPDGIGTDPLKCTGAERSVMDGRKSFPSGHASFAFASMVLATMYLARRLNIFQRENRGDSLKLCFSLSPIFLAAVVAISRTCDYHHHWEDVLCGSILGTVISYITYYQYFPPEEDSSDIPYIPLQSHNYMSNVEHKV